MTIKNVLILNVKALSTFFLDKKRVLNVFTLRIRTLFSCITAGSPQESEDSRTFDWSKVKSLIVSSKAVSGSHQLAPQSVHRGTPMGKTLVHALLV